MGFIGGPRGAGVDRNRVLDEDGLVALDSRNKERRSRTISAVIVAVSTVVALACGSRFLEQCGKAGAEQHEEGVVSVEED